MTAAEQIPSAILTGQAPASPTFFNENEFRELLARTTILNGPPIEHADAIRLTESHWRRLRDAAFLARLERAEAVFESGRSRGRLGALLCLGAVQDLIEIIVPEAKGHLGIIEEIGAALVDADTGELPELFRPGVSAGDDRKHLKLIPGDK